MSAEYYVKWLTGEEIMAVAKGCCFSNKVYKLNF